jgi:GT2 family glycosyltransferase
MPTGSRAAAPEAAGAPHADSRSEPDELSRPARPESSRRSPQARPVENAAPDVSVCVVHRDNADLVRACLGSLLDQPQGAGLEVLVVDNGSADGSAEMVAREFPEVVLLRNDTNRGFARGNNQAAGRARGRYLFFLNNDTVIPPHTLGRLLAYAEAHPEAGLIGPRLRDARGKVQVSYRSRPTLATLLHRTAVLRWTGLLRGVYRRHRREDFDPHTTRAVEVLMGAALLIRRDRFEAWGRWDEQFPFGGEDLELCARVGRFARVVYLPEVEVTHLGRASTRRHAGPASAAIAFGFARYLRGSGTGRLGLLAYKVAVTLDAPLQIVSKSVEYLARRLRGDRVRAAKSARVVRAAAYFLANGLGAFWRA